MKKISLEQLVAGVILTFIDNIDSLGKPQNMPAEEWVKKMTDDDLFKLFDDISNLLIGHGEEKVKEEFCEICGYSNTFDSQEYHDNMPFGLCLKCMEKTGVVNHTTTKEC